MRRLAFTLIEILVVIAIIVVLVGIIWAAMAPARERARETRCMSNLHQIGRALQMYRQDWGGQEAQEGERMEYWQLGLPPTPIPVDSSGPRYLLGTRDIWWCPNAPAMRATTDYSHMHFVSPEDSADFYTALLHRGEEAVYVMCERHSPAEQYASSLTRLLVLRLNGQVQVLKMTVREWLDSGWDM